MNSLRLLLATASFFMSGATLANQTLTSVFQDALHHYDLTGTAPYVLKSRDALAKQARALAGPQFALSLEGGKNKNIVDDHGTGIETDLDLDQTKASASIRQPLFDRELKYQRDAATTEQSAARFQVTQEKQSLAESTTLAYLELQYQNELFLLSKEKYVQLASELQRVQKLVEQGFTASIDISEVLLEIERSKLQIHESHKRVGIAKARLFDLTGKMYPPPSNTKSFQNLEPGLFQVPGFDDLLQSAVQNNLNLKIADLQRQAAEQRYRSARAAVYPKLSLDGEISTSRTRNDLETDTDDATVGLRLKQDFSLLGNARSLNARSARYQSLAERQRSNRLQHEVRTELNSLLADYKGGIQSFFTLRKLLARSESKIQLVRRAVPLGKRFQRDVYDAIVENFSIRETLAAEFYGLLKSQTSIQLQTGSLDDAVLLKIDQTLAAAS